MHLTRCFKRVRRYEEFKYRVKIVERYCIICTSSLMQDYEYSANSKAICVREKVLIFSEEDWLLISWSDLRYQWESANRTIVIVVIKYITTETILMKSVAQRQLFLHCTCISYLHCFTVYTEIWIFWLHSLVVASECQNTKPAFLCTKDSQLLFVSTFLILFISSNDIWPT